MLDLPVFNLLTMARLTGNDLLSYLAANKGAKRDDLVEGAGYVSTRQGKISLQRTRFFEALAAANGHELGPEVAERSGAGGKEPTYLLKVGPSGLVPVSRSYTGQCGMEPGSYVRVIIEDGAVILEPAPEGEAAEACPAPAPALAVAA